MSNSIRVATTIREQIYARGWSIPGSWGTRKMTAHSNMVTGAPRPSLRFVVTGAKFRGKVEVALMADDTYTVIFYRNKLDGVNIIHVADFVFCDNLIDVLDSFIER